jgi:hypothetical protein
MGRHCESAWLVLGLLFMPPIVSMANARVASNASAQSATATAPTSDYIYLDGFELPPDCSVGLTCPVPLSGKSCLSGRLMDAGSGTQLQALFRADLACGSGAVGGACDVSVKVHDAGQFATNPATDLPLASAASTVDGCGRFLVADVTPPGTGFAAIVTDDADPAAENNLRATAATFQSLGSNVRIDDVDALVTLNDTVTQWTASAGSPFGASSFADVGAMLLYFTAGGVARAGVTVLRNGNTVPANDYYFSDASVLERLNVDSAQLSTGLNGSALVVNGTLGNYSGAGAEPMGCTWPSKVAESIPGVVAFIEIDC